uniref:39S ribosomal protein L12, mitochondrial-like n=1 Tax=Hirondellea gigas TaxID=1518452 RepID=A0A2P2I324_9CRUS
MLSSRVIGACRLNSFTCLVRPVLSHSSKSRTRCLSGSATYFAESMPLPTLDGPDKVYPAHIENIVSEISRLTLLEVADLNAALKQRLNIPDAAPMAVMPAGMMMQAGAATGEDEEEVSAVKDVQTSFSVKLTAFDPSKKVAVIKFIKSCVEGFNLVQAKKFVEALPAHVKTDLGKDEAAKLKEELIAIGAEAEVE